MVTNAAGDVTSLLDKSIAYGLTAFGGSPDRPLRVAKSLSPWREGVARHLVRPIAAEWPLLKVLRSVASPDDEWPLAAAAVIWLQNLTG